jgi:hypothetical protein
MSEDVYKMFSSQYSKKVSLLSQQTGERYGKKKSTRNTKASSRQKEKDQVVILKPIRLRSSLVDRVSLYEKTLWLPKEIPL